MNAALKSPATESANVALAAQQYVSAGLILVAFDRGSKGPHHIGWNLRENCIDDAARASNLFGNIGIAHAYSRTCCIDIDDMVAAISWFSGAGLDLSEYWMAHNAVRWSSGMPNRGKLLYRLPAHVDVLPTRMFKGDGVELRCATAGKLTVQDVLPPSIHPTTGKPYSWLGPGSWRDIPLIPADLLAFWKTLASPASGAHEPTARVNAGREDIEAVLAHIKPGALGYSDWLHIGMGLNHETDGNNVGLELWDAWSIGDGNNRLYKGRAELETKWAGFDPKHPNPRTIHTIEKMAGVNLDMASEYEALPPEPAPDTVPPNGGRVDPPAPHRLAFLPDVSFLNRPPLKWYIPRVLPACEITMVYGASGSGKSFFVYDLVAAIAQGHEWCGRKTKKARVARIVAEGSAGDTNRVRAYASMNGGALPGLIECHARVDLKSDDDYLEIGKQIELAGGADIIVVDTLTAAAPTADQNSQMDMGTVIDHCRAIGAATGAMIFWNHHSGKDPSKGSRGSSAIPAAVDVEIEITELSNGNRQAQITKLRDGERGAIFPFVLRQVVLGTDGDGEPITSCVVDHLPGEPSRRRTAAARQPSGATQKIVWKVFQELAGITGEATLAELCDQAVKSMTTVEGQRDTRPQRVMRAIETLGAEDFLVIDKGVVRCI